MEDVHRKPVQTKFNKTIGFVQFVLVGIKSVEAQGK